MTITYNSEKIIERLQLEKHPEGGYYRETYRSGENFSSGSGDLLFPGGRPFSTAIYYLLTSDQISKLHRIKSDEIWHYYLGSPATIHVIQPNGKYQTLYFGPDIDSLQQFQHIIPAGSWFGVTVNNPDSFFLAGCTVSPGFDFIDFEIADSYKLKKDFPGLTEIIEKLS